jgi:cytochrome c peroxidase
VPCNDLPRDVEPTAVAFLDPTTVIVQSREPAQLWLVGLEGTAMTSATPLALTDVSRGDLGHTVFHSNSCGGLACASCHPEGHEDGRVWNFACEGDRRTQDIGGGLAHTEPFHWNGDLGNFSALVNTVFVGRMSGPQLTSDQSAAMLRWIDSVPTLPSPRAPAEAQVARGKAIFNDPTVACGSCHTGTLLTNNATVDVGTSGMFQVPALRGLAWRAPYMHNGCAATLDARFAPGTCSGGDAHGRTSQLTAAQRADLIAYLQSL